MLIFIVDKYILAISLSKLIIFGFYEVIKCFSETPPFMVLIICKFVNDENSIICLKPHSVIFLSFGSIIKASKMPKEKRMMT